MSGSLGRNQNTQMNLAEALPVADLIALKPLSYGIRILFACAAFPAAMSVEKVIPRVIGFVWLLITGVGLLFVGFNHGTIVDILLGIIALGAAGYSWWFTRS